MESIRELRKLLQEEKVNPRGWRRPLGYKTFQRGPSIYITRLLIPTRITPTQVTGAGIVIGLAGCVLLLQLAWYIKLAGLGLLYLSILCDKVDGEIARYKKIFSLRGIFWDEIGHLVIPPLAWFSLALGLVDISIYEERIVLVVAFLGALALAVNRVVHSLPAQIYAKKYIKYRELFSFSSVPSRTHFDIAHPRRPNALRIVARAFHQLQDFFIIIALTAFLLVFERIFLLDYIFHVPLVNFVLGASALFVLFAIENIVKKSLSIESDIQRTAQVEQ